MIKIIDLQIWPTTKMIHKLWESHKWFIEINQRNETQNDYSQKWSPKKMIQIQNFYSQWLFTWMIHKKVSQKLFTKMIHKKRLTKIIHKTDSQNDSCIWFTNLIHKNDSQKYYDSKKWLTKK